MSKHTWIFSMLFVVGTSIASQAHDFSENVLRNLLVDVQTAYGWECTGNACRGVWQEQIRSLDELSSYVDANLADDLKLNAKIGSLAKTTAGRVCGSRATADHATLVRLVSSENRALRRLVNVQVQSGIPANSVRSCNKVIQ